MTLHLHHDRHLLLSPGFDFEIIQKYVSKHASYHLGSYVRAMLPTSLAPILEPSLAPIHFVERLHSLSPEPIIQLRRAPLHETTPRLRSDRFANSEAQHIDTQGTFSVALKPH